MESEEDVEGSDGGEEIVKGEGEVTPTISSPLSAVHSSLEAERRLAYSRSSIALVSALENACPLADLIMKRYV